MNLISNISAIDNGRDVTLTSIRRMGKTGLIKNIFYHLKSLLEKEMVYNEDGEYRVYDLFLTKWLERL